MKTSDISKPRIVIRKLHEFFSATDSLTATITPPEELEWESKEHFLYIFYGCLLDYGMKSSIYHENLKKAYKQKPDLFDPRYIVETFQRNVQDLAAVLKDLVRVRFPNEGARRWLSLSEILLEKYNGDPRDMFTPLMSFDDAKNAVLSIKGFGQKTGGLLVRILYENDLITVQGSLNHIPIDRHDIEISIMLGVVDNDGVKTENATVIEQLSSIWVEASLAEGVDPCEIDRNLWLLGSHLCSKKKCCHCPLNDMCNQ
jgi:endonuclease III